MRIYEYESRSWDASMENINNWCQAALLLPTGGGGGRRQKKGINLEYIQSSCPCPNA